MKLTETIKELIQQVTLFVRTLHAIAQELEEQNRKIYALEENRKIKDAAISVLQKEVVTLKLLARRKVVTDAADWPYCTDHNSILHICAWC